MGNTDSEFDAVLRQALIEGDAVERAVYRSLETEWVKGRLGLPARFDPLAATVCSSASSAAYGYHRSTADFYALTHAVMYFTEFGAQPLPRPMRRDDVARSIEIGTSIAILSEHWDILAELLLAAACANLPVSASPRFAWAMLLAVWDEYGHIPDHPGTQNFDPENRASYHTMHVMGLLCAVSLLTQRFESCSHRIMGDAGAIIGAIVEYVCFSRSLKGQPRRCLQVASAVENIADDELAHVLLRSAVIWALRNNELCSLLELARRCKSRGVELDDVTAAALRRAYCVSLALAALDSEGEVKSLAQELRTMISS